MADVFRLSYQSPLISSPLLLPFRPSPNTPRPAIVPFKQQNPVARWVSTVPDAAAAAALDGNQRLRSSSFKVRPISRAKKMPPPRNFLVFAVKLSLFSNVPTILENPNRLFGRLSESWKSHLLEFPANVYATATEKDDQPKWWEKNAGPNMIDIHSTEEFLNALSQAGDKLVIVEFYGTWCASCRALFPKLCKTAEEHPDILFLKVNFDENKPMCKSLNVKVLPYFHFYRGADGQLESFSCSLAKFQKIKDAIEMHNTARCSIGPPVGVGNINLLGVSNPVDKPAEASSR